MSAPPHSGPATLPLELYTRYGELNLEGRLLIHADQQLAAGNHGAALEALLALVPRAPWLQGVCAGRLQQVLQWRYDQSRQAERELVASAEGSADVDAKPSALLERVLAQPSAQVVVRGCTPALLLEALLQQAVWDAAVWLDPEAIASGTLPAAACWLDGLATDRRPAPLRPLRLRQADWHLRQQGLAWVPRRQPLPCGDALELEAGCLERALQRRLQQPVFPPATEPLALSLVLVISTGDTAAAIRRSLSSLAETRAAAGPASSELLLVHPPLRPGQQAALEKTLAEPAVGAALSDLRRLESAKGAGLALACNQALAACLGHQLLVVQAGVSLGPGVLEALQEALADSSCRAAQPALLSADQRLVGLGYGFARAGQPGQALLHGLAAEPAQRPAALGLQAVQGSCCLLRREELLAVGGWDGQFCDGLEDQDLCLRLIERFGGHCQLRGAVSAEAPLEHGLEARHADRDWNRALFRERWQEQAQADLADLAKACGCALLGLLPEADPPASTELATAIGVLTPA